MIPLLSLVTFLPGAAGLALLFVPRRSVGVLRVASLAVTVVTFVLSLPLYVGFDPEIIGYQFEENRRWMPTLGAAYHVGIDGISLLLVLLTTFLMPLALASAWGVIEDRFKEFVATMLILETGMLGVFVSLDLFLFYVFWEAMLIPMYFVIGVWGGPNRIYAAVKFVLYTMVGSVLMLIASLAFGPLVWALAVTGIIYGAWVSTVQPDMKKLVAYSSVSHLGFVMLGIFTLNQQGVTGGLIQMVNHGLSTGALFLMVGMIYERRHSRLIADFGGLWRVVPPFSALFLVVLLSSLGLPGLNGVVGEFLILVGAFQRSRWLAALATSGIIFAAVYLLWMYQRVIFGEVTRDANRGLKDLTTREWAVLVPVVALIVWIGVYPAAFTGKTEATIEALLAQVQAKASAHR